MAADPIEGGSGSGIDITPPGSPDEGSETQYVSNLSDGTNTYVIKDSEAREVLENLVAVHVVVETYQNGTSWYRVWSDGWIEQGGFAARTAVTQEVTFLKPFANTNYNIQISARHTADSTDGRPPLIRGVSTTQFTLNLYTAYEGAYWYACGY